jgi:hypothetical protein
VIEQRQCGGVRKVFHVALLAPCVVDRFGV